MAIKQGETYYACVLTLPGGEPALVGELPDVRDDGRFPSMDCKHCYTDDAPTVASYEEDVVQALCALCGAGLTDLEKAAA